MLAKCHISVVTVPVGEELTVSLVTNSRRGVLLGEAVNGIVGVLGCKGEMKVGPVSHPQDRC